MRNEEVTNENISGNSYSVADTSGIPSFNSIMRGRYFAGRTQAHNQSTVNSEQNRDRKYQNADLIEDLRANCLPAYVQIAHKPFRKGAWATHINIGRTPQRL